MLVLQVTYKFFFIMTLISSVVSCNKESIYTKKKIPVQNAKFLSGEETQIKQSTIPPKTQVQYGNYEEPVNNDSFYNSLFDQNAKQEKTVVITDEVATNNIATIKKKVIGNAKAYYLQIGAYSSKKNAIKVEKKAKKFGHTSLIPAKKNNKDIIKVHVGPLSTLKDAVSLQHQLSVGGFSKTMIINK